MSSFRFYVLIGSIFTAAAMAAPSALGAGAALIAAAPWLVAAIFDKED